MIPQPLTPSQGGMQLTERFEACRLVAYWDTLGKVWTVGWGATGAGISSGTVWTQEQADSWLQARYGANADTINQIVNVQLTQGEFDALCDFAYNAGISALEGSTLLRLLNTGDFSGASQEFDKWDHAGGQVIAGLLRRREAETQEFNA